jgi:penicillin-binding protein 1C
LLAAQRRVMGRLPGPDDPPLAVPPPELAPRSICALSGLEATELCPAVETEWLPADRPLVSCRWHRRRGARVVVSWPPPYRAWAREHGLLDVPTIADTRRADDGASSRPGVVAAGALRIVNPPGGATYLRDPTLRDAFQTLPLRAVAGGHSRLAWEVDGRAVGSALPEAAVPWPLTPGRHVVSVEDEHGHRDLAEIVVK